MKSTKTPFSAMMLAAMVVVDISLIYDVEGFTPFTIAQCYKPFTTSSSATTLNFFGGGSGAKDLDEEVRILL
jgi:hypothetical protein